MPCTLCDREVFARGLCRRHWNRWRRYGDANTVRQVQGDDRVRLAQHFTEGGPDDCWPWIGQRNANGYGRSSVKGRKTYAHRTVYEVWVGPIPDGHDIDHLCHNRDETCPGGTTCPHRACVNPAHLIPLPKGQNRGQANRRR